MVFLDNFQRKSNEPLNHKNNLLIKQISFKFISLRLLIVFASFFSNADCQWPSVEKMLKSHYLPSLEVKIHPPDEYQPKVQAEIAKMESEREKSERKLMQTIEKDYNNELNDAAEKISKIIQDALSIFDDKNLLNKSAEYAINPPLIMITKAGVNDNSRNKNQQPSFREIANFSMTNIQKDTLKALIEDDNKIEKLRNPKVEISLGDGLEKKTNSNYITGDDLNNSKKYNKFKDTTKISSSINKNNKNRGSVSISEDEEISDGPIDIDLFQEQESSDKNEYSSTFINRNSMTLTSFLELKADSGKYSKPISVIMKLPEEPDSKVKSEINKAEKDRVDHEKKLFTKAKEEFKLITQITIKELQLNLDHELIPFFVVSKNDLSGLKGIISKNFPKKSLDKGRFLQIDESEINDNFNSSGNSRININSEDKNSIIDFNKYTYEKILQLFSSDSNDKNNDNFNGSDNYRNIYKNKNNEYSSVKDESSYKNNKHISDITSKYKLNLDNNFHLNSSSFKDKDNIDIKDSIKESQNKSSNSNINENKDIVSFNFESCIQMQKQFSNLNLNCEKLNLDYNQISSFLEVNSEIKSKEKLNLRSKTTIKGGGEEDFINVKFSAAEESYPTIEKLVAQMFTRRDLAEKFERLKILEFETNLQKAENEMIQDLLHEELYKIMAKYGPAIEGMRQHIK